MELRVHDETERLALRDAARLGRGVVLGKHNGATVSATKEVVVRDLFSLLRTMWRWIFQCDRRQTLAQLPPKTFTVTARAKSSAVFRRGDALGMDYNLNGRPLHLEMHTRRVGEGGAFMGDLQVTAFAQADAPEEAAALVTRGREMAIIVSLAANASIAPLEPELVYETTDGVTKRQFLQRFIPADEMSYGDRVVPLEATAALLTSLAQHEHRDRAIRAISQYSEALLRWDHGNELLVLAHLFMGVEAIKKVAWRVEASRRGLSKEELAAEWGFDPGGRIRIDEYLDRTARLRLVFNGDAQHHKIAKDVSDSFEHGFANAGNLYKPAASALVPTATYLRECIIDVLDLPEEARRVLLGEPYCHPRGPAALEQYFRGVLIAPPGTRLATAGQDHPYCVWQIEVQARPSEEGSHEYRHNPTMTAVIGEGVQLRPLNHEVWARGTFRPQSARRMGRTPKRPTTDLRTARGGL